jgi:hypothetical protein
VQRRHGFEDFSYLAIARRRPRRSTSSLAQLLLRDAG